MKRRSKEKSSLYAYLDSLGVLESGDDKAIEAAKRQYWSMVKSKWNKDKRKTFKAFTVYLDTKEAKVVQAASIQQHSSATNFIKQSALSIAARGRYTDATTIGEIRQLLVNHYHHIEQYADAIGLSSAQSQHFLQDTRRLEEGVMKLLWKGKK
jgi:hypothetical protein